LPLRMHVHVTPAFAESLVTIAVNVCERVDPVVVTYAVLGKREIATAPTGGGAVIETVILADSVGSATDVAVITTEPPVGTEDGAV